MYNEQRFKSLLGDLGKATLRGVRKCPKCGTYNGSRGTICKNRFCDVVFKEPSEKKKMSIEACKLINQSSYQIFSVPVKEKGLEHRGFVQLPSENMNSTDLLPIASQGSSLCFIDSCQKNNSILRCNNKNSAVESVSSCQHIEAASRCCAEAKPLILKNSMLSTLNINNETKQEMWLLATQTPGPLVQRVSKSTMVVKCKTSSKHPLGMLHFSFLSTKLKEKVEYKYSCGCSSSKELKVTDNSSFPVKCIHFYACICAFKSDEKLSDEFKYFINLDNKMNAFEDPIDLVFNISEDADKFADMELDGLSVDDSELLIFRDEVEVQNIQTDKLEFLNNLNLDSLSNLSSNIIDSTKCQDSLVLHDAKILAEVSSSDMMCPNSVYEVGTLKVENSVFIDSHFELDDSKNQNLFSNFDMPNSSAMKLFDCSNNAFHAIDKQCSQQQIVSVSKNLSTDNNSSIKLSVSPINKKKLEKQKCKRVNLSKKAKTDNDSIKIHINQCENVDESITNLPFIQWLASITERINQTMHYQFSGKPEPLVFHAPQMFFECLRERISYGAKKKRLPNSTTAFVRKDGVPLGTFTKYTWQITNILHVKSIFETPFMPLEITRTFVQNVDGTYNLYKREETDIDRFKKTRNNAFIKPVELKTYLKVGNTSPNQVHPTPFVIEWIPDVLPISKVGELRIIFEYGHIKNESLQKLKKIALSKNY